MDIITSFTYLHIQHLFSWGGELGGVHHCVTVVGKCIFDSNFTFALLITKDSFYYCCTNDNVEKVINGYKRILKIIRFCTKDNTKSVIQK